MVQCITDYHGDRFALYHGDAVHVLSQLPGGCIDLAVFSPPFSGLYLYNDSMADMGNSESDEAFFEHYAYFTTTLTRALAPGRLAVVHCKDLVFYQTQRGTAGLRDFPGALIRAHEAAGLNFHSRITVWRCPVHEMTKTKAQGLLYKQLRADSSLSRQGLAEYLLVFRKWPKEGEESVSVVHTFDDFPLLQWQEWASPVWMETRQTDVLDSERSANDEKHICPMPKDLIRRSILLWSNPGDTVLDPFTGIGSTGAMALEAGRRFVGIELKAEYCKQAADHLQSRDRQQTLMV